MIGNNLLIYNNLIYVINQNINIIIENINGFKDKVVINKLNSLLFDLLDIKNKLLNRIYINKDNTKVPKIEIERMYKRLKELL